MPWFPNIQSLRDWVENFCPDFVEPPETEPEKPVKPWKDHPECIGAVDDPSVCYWCGKPVGEET